MYALARFQSSEYTVGMQTSVVAPIDKRPLLKMIDQVVHEPFAYPCLRRDFNGTKFDCCSARVALLNFAIALAFCVECFLSDKNISHAD